MALNFPPSDASPWTAPNGVVYTWNTDGYWEAKADPADLDGEYLKLDASNDPVTGTCEFSDGVSVTGGSAAGVDIGMYADTVNNRLHFTSNSHEGMSLFPDGRFIIRPNNAGNALDISGNIAAGGASNTYVIHSRPTITGTSTSTLFGLVYTTTNDGDLANVNHFYAASATGSGSISGVENIYLAASGSQQGSSVRGFLSNINAVNGKDNYNFYANGDAPNYFAGLTEHEGGVSLTGGTDVHGIEGSTPVNRPDSTFYGYNRTTEIPAANSCNRAVGYQSSIRCCSDGSVAFTADYAHLAANLTNTFAENQSARFGNYYAFDAGDHDDIAC